MAVNTKYRSAAPEIMDDFQMEGEILKDALDKIANINQLLGGNKVTLNGIKLLIKNIPKNQVIQIVDMGCGNGDMLRMLAEYAKKEGLSFLLKGIDANEFTINYATEISKEYPNVSFLCMNMLNDQKHSFLATKEPFTTCDIILCTLTLHHFKDEEIIKLLTDFKISARIGIVINDLERSALAYHLFKALCYAFRLNHMSREDGLVSILRGFKKADLQRFSELLKFKNNTINWKWAFRYQWIIKTR